MTSSQKTPAPCQWFSRLATAVDAPLLTPTRDTVPWSRPGPWPTDRHQLDPGGQGDSGGSTPRGDRGRNLVRGRASTQLGRMRVKRIAESTAREVEAFLQVPSFLQPMQFLVFFI